MVTVITCGEFEVPDAETVTCPVNVPGVVRDAVLSESETEPGVVPPAGVTTNHGISDTALNVSPGLLVVTVTACAAGAAEPIW